MSTLLTCTCHTTPHREKGGEGKREGEKKGNREGEGGERVHTRVVCMTCVTKDYAA